LVSKSRQARAALEIGERGHVFQKNALAAHDQRAFVSARPAQLASPVATTRE